jgi:hypothetical protein
MSNLVKITKDLSVNDDNVAASITALKGVNDKIDAPKEDLTVGKDHTLLSDNTFASGYKNIAGGKAFKILADPTGTDGETGTYQLDDVTGIEVGMWYSAATNLAVYHQGQITAVNTSNKTVTVDNFKGWPLNANTDNLEGYAIYNLFFIDGHPELGTTVAGYNAVAQGYKTSAQNVDSHAEGRLTIAVGKYGHAEGLQTITGHGSHAEGNNTWALGSFAHAEGSNTRAKGDDTHAEGTNSQAIGNQSHAEGLRTKATAYAAHSEGVDTEATVFAAHAEGSTTHATGEVAHAEGYNTTASGIRSHAEGENTTASGQTAHAEGRGTSAIGNVSHAEGLNTEVSTGAWAGHAEGYATKSTAAAGAAHAEGYETEAAGMASHSEGRSTIAKGAYSHAEGIGTEAVVEGGHVQGKYNLKDSMSRWLHIVGNGTSDSARSNAHTIDTAGNAWFKGLILTGGDSQSNAPNVVAYRSKQFSAKLNNYWNGESDCININTADNTYTISSSFITPTNVIEIVPDPNITPDQWAAYRDAEFIGGVQQAGSIVVRCMGAAPTVAVPVIFVVRGDMP